MEKFYIANEDSKLRKDYLEYEENSEKIRILINKFFEDFGITAESFIPGNSSLSIVATKEDKEKFSSQLCKPNNGLSRFKANSKIKKAWVEVLKLNNIEVLHKPFIPFYFGIGFGRTSSRIFEIEGIVYCSFKSESDFESKDKLTEIKASEFYKIVEDYNESLKANKESKDE